MSLDDYNVVLYRNEPSGWVAEVPSVPDCHALMPTREAALSELAEVFQSISDKYTERNQILPATVCDRSVMMSRVWDGQISLRGGRD